MANQDLTLALKIKALIEGMDQVKALAVDLGKIESQSNTPMGDPTPALRHGIEQTSSLAVKATSAIKEFFALGAIEEFVRRSIDNFNEAERGFRGLEAVANASGTNVGKAMESAGRLSADGTLSLIDAQRSIQNLLAHGMDLGQAEQSIAAIKDMAAANRAANMSMGEAVLTATEALKKGRAIGLEEAGVIGKLPEMWDAYAKSIGKTTADLDEHDKALAETAALTKAAAAYNGEAAAGAERLGGQMGQAANEVKALSADIGKTLAPALIGLIRLAKELNEDALKPTVSWFTKLGIAANEALQLVQAPGGPGVMARWKEISDAAKEAQAANVAGGFPEKPLTPFQKFLAAERGTPPTAPDAKFDLPKLQRDTQAYFIVQQALLDNDKAANERAFQEKLINATAYYAKVRELAEAEAALELGKLVQQKLALNAEIAALGAVKPQNADDTKQRNDALRQAKVQLSDVDAAITARQIKLTGDLNKARDEEIFKNGEVLKSAQALVEGIDQENFVLDLSDNERARATKLLELEAFKTLIAADAYNKLRDALNAAFDAKPGLQAVKSLQDMIEALEKESFLLELTDTERERANALLTLEAAKVGLTAEAYEKLRKALLAALDDKGAADARKKALDDAKKQADEIYKALTENLQKSLADVLNNAFLGKNSKSVVLQFVDFIRTSLSNVLSAKFTQEILGLFPKDKLLGVGGFLGLGSKRGENAANPVFVQDISKGAGAITSGSTFNAAGGQNIFGNGGTSGGAITSGSVFNEAGGQNMFGNGGASDGLFSGVWDSISGFFQKFATSIGSFFTGLMKGIGGLFSGGGGGGDSWIAGAAKFIGSLFHFADGGWTGPGGKYQPAGLVHADEFVFDKASTNRLGVPLLNWLHTLGRGIAAPTMPRWGFDTGGLVNLPAGNAGANGAMSSLRVVLVDDHRRVGDFIQSAEGDRVLIQWVRRNAMSVKQFLR
jgi:hypothetical protein